MKYNRNISFSANIFLAKNKIEKNIKKYINNEIVKPYIPSQLVYKPKIAFVILGDGNNNAYNSLINQSYINISVTKLSHFDLKNCDADYICFVNYCDTYYNNAVYSMVESLQENQYDMIYSDEDIAGKHFYKPDWSPDTLKSINYIGMAMIKREYVTKFDDYYKFLIELSDKDLSVYHISKTLYKSDRKINVGKRKLQNINDKISIIIPSKDNYDVLKRCVDSIRNKSTYHNYEIIVVDNGSKDQGLYTDLCDKYVYEKCDFNFSKMCNLGAKNADGDYLLFLNDDTEVISENWLELMAGYANEKNIGAVGAKLYYPGTDLIQHCGVVNIQQGPVHSFIGFSDSASLYFGRNRYNYNVSAVTAACMMIKKDRFLGFDEDFEVSYNDVDLCFRLIENGYNNIVLNDVKLYHYESLTRGNDKDDLQKMQRLSQEKFKLYDKHSDFCCNDKCYNVNLTWHRADFTNANLEPVIPERFIEYKSQPIEAKIEYMYIRENILFIGGYFIKSGLNRVYVSFDGNEKYIARANIELRSDLSALYGKKYSLSGFSAAIDIGRLKGENNIKIIIVNKFGKSFEYKTDKSINIK